MRKKQWLSLQQRIQSHETKLRTLPIATLELSVEETAAAMNLCAQNRPLRQQLTALHARFAPLRKQLSLRQQSLIDLKTEQETLSAGLARKREVYKEKNQLLSEVTTICELENRIKDWRANAPVCNRGIPARCAAQPSTRQLRTIRRSNRA